jgi:hypothetical protein
VGLDFLANSFLESLVLGNLQEFIVGKVEYFIAKVVRQETDPLDLMFGQDAVMEQVYKEGLHLYFLANSFLESLVLGNLQEFIVGKVDYFIALEHRLALTSLHASDDTQALYWVKRLQLATMLYVMDALEASGLYSIALHSLRSLFSARPDSSGVSSIPSMRMRSEFSPNAQIYGTCKRVDGGI